MGDNKELDKEPQYRIETIKVPCYGGMSIIDNLTTNQLSTVLSLYNENHRKFSHHHNIFENNLDNLLTLPQKEMEKLTYIYLKSCEDLVYFIYSGTANYGHFNLIPGCVIDKETTIKNIFDEGYINMLKSLLNKIWRSKYDNELERNKISINGIDIDDKNFDKLITPQISTQKIAINKRFLNTYLSLFLRNSLEDHCGGGGSERKNASIEIGDNYIRITDIPIREFYSKEMKEIRAKRFQEKHIFDGPLNFENKTIRSFYEMIKMLNEYGYNYKFDCGFNDDLNFFIELKF